MKKCIFWEATDLLTIGSSIYLCLYRGMDVSRKIAEHERSKRVSRVEAETNFSFVSA